MCCCLPNYSSLSEGLRPSDSPTRALARRFAGSLRSRGSLAAARSLTSVSRIAVCEIRSSRPTGISRTTLRGWQHIAKTACSKNVHNFVPRQALVEEAGSRKAFLEILDHLADETSVRNYLVRPAVRLV